MVAGPAESITLAMGVVLRPRTHLEGRAGHGHKARTEPSAEALQTLAAGGASHAPAHAPDGEKAMDPAADPIACRVHGVGQKGLCMRQGLSGVWISTQACESHGKGRASEKGEGQGHGATGADLPR